MPYTLCLDARCFTETRRFFASTRFKLCLDRILFVFCTLSIFGVGFLKLKKKFA